MGYRAVPNGPTKRNGKPKYHQGQYYPLNPSKYLGDMSCIYWRSSWEQKLYYYLDTNPRVLKWNVEGITIPYEIFENNSWTTNRYYPDAYAEVENADGSISKVVIEVKPWSEYSPGSKKGTDTENIPLLPPNPPKIKTAKSLENHEYKLKMFQKNILKWKAAKQYCERRGLEYLIMTEKFFEGKQVKLF